MGDVGGGLPFALRSVHDDALMCRARETEPSLELRRIDCLLPRVSDIFEDLKVEARGLMPRDVLKRKSPSQEPGQARSGRL